MSTTICGPTHYVLFSSATNSTIAANYYNSGVRNLCNN